jgi:hypothetical protein
MVIAQNRPRFLEEIAEFLASSPTREQLLNFHPSEEVQQRAGELLAKLKNGRLTEEEQQELDQFVHIERLMGLVKATLHAKKVSPS